MNIGAADERTPVDFDLYETRSSFGILQSQKAAGLNRVTFACDTGLPALPTVAKSNHFLFLIRTGIGQDLISASFQPLIS